MANQNTPYGLRPVRLNSGEPYNGQARMYQIPASDTNAYFVGDPVIKTAGTADANGIPGVTLASAGAGNLITGVIVGFVAQGGMITSNGPFSRPAAAQTAAWYVLVADDPGLIFAIQENDNVGGVAGTPLAVTAVGKNANLVSGSGSTSTGNSGWMLQANGTATTQNFQLNIVEFFQEAGAVAAALYAKVLVRINQHTETPNSSGI